MPKTNDVFKNIALNKFTLFVVKLKAIMKSKPIITIVAFSIFLLISTAFQTQTATEYNNLICNEQQKLAAKNIEYLQKALYSDNLALVESKRVMLVNEIQAIKQRLIAIGPYKEDHSFKNAGLAYMDACMQAFNTEYRLANSLKIASTENYSSLKKYVDAMERAESVLNDALIAFKNAQQAFGKKQGYVIEENNSKEAKLLAAFKKAYPHQRRLDLSVMRTHFAHNQFINAFNSNQNDKLENLRAAIVESAGTSTNEINALSNVAGDEEMKKSGLALIGFYEKTASKPYAEVAKILADPAGLSQAQAERVNTILKETGKRNVSIVNSYNQSLLSFMTRYFPAK